MSEQAHDVVVKATYYVSGAGKIMEKRPKPIRMQTSPCLHHAHLDSHHPLAHWMHGVVRRAPDSATERGRPKVHAQELDGGSQLAPESDTPSDPYRACLGVGSMAGGGLRMRATLCASSISP